MATEVHPTAVVGKNAIVGNNCSIGPYSVIGDHVQLGAGTRIHSHVVLDGHTRLGENCEVFSFACLGKQTQDLKYDGGTAYVEIGEGTTLREYVTVNAATADGAKTVIGKNCHILAYCHIAHDCQLGNHVIMSNSTQLAGHVTIGDNAVFGGLAGVHQFVRIGQMAMISATAKAVQDVMPFCLVDGSPAALVSVNKIGMRRHGKSDEVILAVNKAYKIFFRSNLTVEKAVEMLEVECVGVAEVDEMIKFARKCERGLARPRHK